MQTIINNYKAQDLKSEFGITLQEASIEPGTCSMVSYSFSDYLDALKIENEIITIEIKKELYNNDENGTLITNHTAVYVKGLIVDFTINQFNLNLTKNIFTLEEWHNLLK